jgi:hypothetical protein
MGQLMVRNAPAQLQNPQNPRAQGIQEKAGDFTAKNTENIGL